jgi:hypothetical protein
MVCRTIRESKKKDKSGRPFILPICGSVLCQPIITIFGTFDDLTDFSKCAKFRTDWETFVGSELSEKLAFSGRKAESKKVSTLLNAAAPAPDTLTVSKRAKSAVRLI